MMKIIKKFNKSSILYVAISAKMKPIFQTYSFKTNKVKFDCIVQSILFYENWIYWLLYNVSFNQSIIYEDKLFYKVDQIIRIIQNLL